MKLTLEKVFVSFLLLHVRSTISDGNHRDWPDIRKPISSQTEKLHQPPHESPVPERTSYRKPPEPHHHIPNKDTELPSEPRGAIPPGLPLNQPENSSPVDLNYRPFLNRDATAYEGDPYEKEESSVQPQEPPHAAVLFNRPLVAGELPPYREIHNIRNVALANPEDLSNRGFFVNRPVILRELPRFLAEPGFISYPHYPRPVIIGSTDGYAFHGPDGSSGGIYKRPGVINEEFTHETGEFFEPEKLYKSPSFYMSQPEMGSYLESLKSTEHELLKIEGNGPRPGTTNTSSPQTVWTPSRSQATQPAPKPKPAPSVPKPEVAEVNPRPGAPQPALRPKTVYPAPKLGEDLHVPRLETDLLASRHPAHSALRSEGHKSLRRLEEAQPAPNPDAHSPLPRPEASQAEPKPEAVQPSLKPEASQLASSHETAEPESIPQRFQASHRAPGSQTTHKSSNPLTTSTTKPAQPRYPETSRERYPPPEPVYISPPSHPIYAVISDALSYYSNDTILSSYKNSNSPSRAIHMTDTQPPRSGARKPHIPVPFIKIVQFYPLTEVAESESYSPSREKVKVSDPSEEPEHVRVEDTYTSGSKSDYVPIYYDLPSYFSRFNRTNTS